MNNRPNFPDFTKFTFEDREWYEKFYAHFSPAADFSFPNLMAWCNLNNDLEYSWLNNNVVFRFSESFSRAGEKIITILGNTDPLNTIRTIKQHFPNTNIAELPEDFCAPLLNDSSIELAEDRKNWDYVCDVNDFLNMQGKQYTKIRRAIQNFLRNNSEKSFFKTLEWKDMQVRSQLASALHIWENIYTRPNDKAHVESLALTRRLQLGDQLEQQCMGLYIDRVLKGFFIYYLTPQPGVVILNHLKSSYEYQYMNDFMVYIVLSHLKTLNITLVNLEQDLGIDGLRFNKEHLRPKGFIKKYNVVSIKPEGL